MSTGNSSSMVDDMEEREAVFEVVLEFVESLALLGVDDFEDDFDEDDDDDDEPCALRRGLAGACRPSNCKAALAMCRKMSM